MIHEDSRIDGIEIIRDNPDSYRQREARIKAELPPQTRSTIETIDKFNELAHIGKQASLPPADNGFTPRWETFEADDGTTFSADVANMNYYELPWHVQRAYTGITTQLSAYVMNAVRQNRGIDEELCLEGRKRVYRGWIEGRYGNVLGMYHSGNEAERAQEQEIFRRRSYDKLVPKNLQNVEESILCLGFWALCHPDIFPAVAELFPADGPYPKRHWIEQLPGIQEAKVRGIAATNRVVQVSGRATELQAALLEGSNEGNLYR